MSEKKALEFILTNAGRNAMINAEHTGTQEIILDEVQFGTGQWTPTADATALQQVKVSVEAVGGQDVGDGKIHVTACDYSNLAYNVYEIGVFARIINTAEPDSEEKILFAICSTGEGGEPILQKSAMAIAAVAFDVFIGDASTDSISFGDTNFQNPPATTTVAGVAMIATLEEALLGTNGDKIITPSLLVKVLSDASSQARIALDTAIKQMIAENGSTSTEVLSTYPSIDNLNDKTLYLIPTSNSISPPQKGTNADVLEEYPVDSTSINSETFYLIPTENSIGDINQNDLDTNLKSLNIQDSQPDYSTMKIGDAVVSSN